MGRRPGRRGLAWRISAYSTNSAAGHGGRTRTNYPKIRQPQQVYAPKERMRMATKAETLYTNTRSDVRIEYDGRVEGALPIVAAIYPGGDEDTFGIDTLATVWLMPEAEPGFLNIQRAADGIGGNVKEVWKTVQRHPDLIDLETWGETRIVVIDLVEGGFMPEKVLAMALHAAGAEHGAKVFANSTGANHTTLENLGFSNLGGLYHLSTYLVENWREVSKNLPA